MAEVGKMVDGEVRESIVPEGEGVVVGATEEV